MDLFITRLRLIGAVVGLLVASWSAAQPPADPLAAVEQSIAAAETSLRGGELQIAESQYRAALMAGWMLVGALRLSEQRLPEARDAFARASTAVVDADTAFLYLAIVQLQTADVRGATTILTRLASARPRDLQIHRLLAQALMASGEPAQAVQELEEASGTAPDDLEIKFALAAAHLQRKNLDAADRLFSD